MRISDRLSYEEATEIKRIINKYFADKGITEEFLARNRKNFNQCESNNKLNLVIKSWSNY